MKKQGKGATAASDRKRRKQAEDLEGGSERSVPGLARGLAVMEFLARRSGGCTQREIAEEFGIPVSSVFRLVNQLEGSGYINRDQESKQMRLSLKMLCVGQRAVLDTNVNEFALPVMRRLRNKLGPTVALGVLNGTGVVTVECVIGLSDFSISLSPGSMSPIHASAPGKMLVASLPADERERLIDKIEFKRYTDRTIKDVAGLRAEIKAIRARGYAMDDNERTLGVCCAAAPVRDRTGQTIAALWLTAPDEYLAPADLPSAAAEVVAAANEISANLGWIQRG